MIPYRAAVALGQNRAANFCIRSASLTASTTAVRQSRPRLVTVTEYVASDQGSTTDKDGAKRSHKNAAIYIPDGPDAWKELDIPTQQAQSASFSVQDYVFTNIISHFLPSKYPRSVQPEYTKFTSFCFAASVAGSAGMVLSTQTLLLAVGVVGSHQIQTAGIMAGALNWVLKDGVGQLGGVWFASRMGHTKRFDTHPKKWRMTAALALDAAALVEILSPFAASWMVLPVACAANVLKNIGFLTASASRAALHQSIALDNNLADVTVKAGTQSMAAGLLGTGVGLGLSTTVLGNDPANFVMGFCCLSAAHIGCNYMAMQYVSIDHLNRQRLDLLLDAYFERGEVLNPSQVASHEQYFPLLKERDSSDWLSIGSRLQAVAPKGMDQLEELMQGDQDVHYLISACDTDRKIHLVFLENATGEDLLKGVFHAYALRQQQISMEPGAKRIAKHNHGEVRDRFDIFREQIQAKGWRTKLTNVEPPGSIRLAIAKEL